MSFFKHLADITNFEHWRIPYSKKDYYKPFLDYFQLTINEFDLCKIFSVNFYNSLLCVIQTRAPEVNKLGKRIITGSADPIFKNTLQRNGTTINDMAVNSVFEVKNDQLFYYRNKKL